MNTADRIDTGEKPYERNWSGRNPFIGRAIPAQSGAAPMTEGAYQRLIGDLLQDDDQLTLRDRFAMATLTGLMNSDVNATLNLSHDERADFSYTQADAMMKARAK